ncbi:uncharacterized protein MONOS_17673 [Monocercomonoides exilis]|uniref:uncharacterized protein n=1 Tax=Monocercomonoides exilis TaxID=2049356 RepID=UPI00355ABAF1|nr:hypothetical protein MONOS_17673 [Monocercomonoides exilis]
MVVFELQYTDQLLKNATEATEEEGEMDTSQDKSVCVGFLARKDRKAEIVKEAGKIFNSARVMNRISGKSIRDKGAFPDLIKYEP